jgi:hypothetical protein
LVDVFAHEAFDNRLGGHTSRGLLDLRRRVQRV